jgi:D-alanine-D-alanine ligase
MVVLSPGKIRVAVIRGGPSADYDGSLATGQHVLSLLRANPERYDPQDIFISKDGEWHKSGIVYEPHRALAHTDLVWNALHGAYGEDGQVQRLLESLQVPFTGSSSLASAVSMNKDLAKSVYATHGLHIPKHVVVTHENFSDELLDHIFRNYLYPVVVKPVSGSGSQNVFRAHSWAELRAAIMHVLKLVPKVLVEEFIRGRHTSVGVIENARGMRLYALMPDGALTREEKKSVESVASRAHDVLGLRHYSTSDFVITPRGKVYILETNSLPRFDEDSHMHKSLVSLGWKPEHFVDHIISLALER